MMDMLGTALMITTMYGYMTMIIAFVIAGYLLKGVGTAKSCIKFFGIIQVLPIVGSFLLDTKIGIGTCAMSIILYIVLAVLWRFCNAKEDDYYRALTAYERYNLEKRMYEYFVYNQRNADTAVDHDKI